MQEVELVAARERVRSRTTAFCANGKKWSSVTTPQPGGTGSGNYNELRGVSCASPSSCWAVGVNGPSPGFNEALRFNGKTWSYVSPGDPGIGNALAAVSCSSHSSCWAVGSYTTGDGSIVVNEALRWNGVDWNSFPVPQPGGTGEFDFNEFLAVACASAKDCMAVGSYVSNSSSLNEALHWNGKKWSTS